MARMIKVDDIKWQSTQNGGWERPYEYVTKQDINRMPAVDAVEVVRCKDCKKWYRHTEVDRERGECRRYQTTKHESGYCDRGERRNDG